MTGLHCSIGFAERRVDALVRPLRALHGPDRTHTHANVDAWLERHPRFHLHFTPTSSSWLNLVERWFRELTDKAIRRGVFHSVPDLLAAIEEFLAAHNGDPQSFTWTASVDSILEKVGRCKAILETVH